MKNYDHIDRTKEKIFFNMNSQELTCFIMRVIIFSLGMTLILLVISKIIFGDRK